MIQRKTQTVTNGGQKNMTGETEDKTQKGRKKEENREDKMNSNETEKLGKENRQK